MPRFFGFLSFEQIEDKAPEGGKVLDGVSGAHSALIFSKTHVQYPM
jgi:hypothetical protein